MVLGDNGAAYATDTQTIQAFNVNSGQSLWAYTSQAPGGINIIGAATNGTLVAKEFASNNTETVLRFNQVGQPTYDGSGSAIPSAGVSSLVDFSWTGYEIGINPGLTSLASISSPVLDWTDSFWGVGQGSPAHSGTSVEMSWFPPLPSCPGAQTPCAQEPLEDALQSLRTLVSVTCAACSQFVFTPANISALGGNQQ